MILLFLGLHHDVINIIFNFTMHHVVKHGCHDSLVCGPGILKIKWHDGAVEIPNRCAECGFIDVL